MLSASRSCAAYPRIWEFKIAAGDFEWRPDRISCEPFSSTDEASDFREFHYLPLYRDRSFLHQKYVAEGLSIGQISQQIFSSKEAVRKGLLKVGIALREPHRNPIRIRYGQKKFKGRPVRHFGEERVIGAIRDMRQRGLSLRQIASFLDNVGVPTKRRGKAWHPEMVKRILEIKAGGESVTI